MRLRALPAVFLENLRQRGFPTVPPGGSTAVNLQSVGDGYVTVECRDTYM